jgi:hypothetical protein
MGLLATSASAAPALDPVMGNWEGEWKQEGGDNGGKVAAKIIAQGGDRYEGIYTTEILGSSRTIKIPLIAKKTGDKVELTGKFDLGADLGGEYKVSAVIEGDEYAGVSESESASSKTRMKRVHKQSPTLGEKPPAGAVVLFDGTNLDQWRLRNGDPAPWSIVDGAMKVAFKKEGGKILKGDLVSKPTFTDAKIHLEFMTPFMPTMRGQMRGNSGVYVQGLYEVQVLDSFGLPPKDNEVGGIYQAAVPKENAALPPGEWQTYDMEFRAPQFDQAGKMIKPGVITVMLNGVVIHDKVQLKKPTPGNAGNDMKKPGPIMLQDHGNPVQFRNIWFAPIQAN